MSTFHRIRSVPITTLWLLTALAGCAYEVAEPSQVATVDQDLLLADGTVLWNGGTSKNTAPLGTGADIPVCWVVAPMVAADGSVTCSGATTSKDCLGKTVAFRSSVKARIQNKIERTWATHGDIEPFGWQNCAVESSGKNAGKHDETKLSGWLTIQLAHVQECKVATDCGLSGSACKGGFCTAPVDVSDVGRASNRPTKIQYNWPAINDGVNDGNIIHEFGHALGFSHEWLRKDWTLGRCGDRAVSGHYLGTGPNDTDSIMDYCHDAGSGEKPELSTWDVLGLQQAYGRKPTGSLVGDRGLCADIKGGSTANGTAVIGYPCRGQWNDTFKRTSSNKKRFQTRSKSRCLNVSGSVGANPVISWDCVDSTNEYFEMKGAEWRGMGNMCAHANGSSVEVRACNGSTSQKWDFFGAGGKRIDQIQLSGTSKCVSTQTSQGAFGEQLVLRTCSSSDTKQRFKFPGQGRVVFGNNTGFCANVAGGQPQRSDLILWNGCGTNPPYNSQFSLRGALEVGNFCMQSANVGSQLQMRSCTGGANQTWDYYF